MSDDVILLKKCLRAFNLLPYQRLSRERGDTTYELAAEIDRYLDRTPIERVS